MMTSSLNKTINAELRQFKGISSSHFNQNSSYNNDNQVLCEAVLTGLVFSPELISMLLHHADGELYSDIIDAAGQQYGVNATKLNSTFWKSFDEVRNTPDIIRLLQQLVHYASTYGAKEFGIWNGDIYEPEPLPNDLKADIQYLTPISLLDNDELKQRVYDMLNGIALSEETLDDLYTIIKYDFNFDIDINKIKNREFQMFVMDKMPSSALPFHDFDLMTRYLVYVASDKQITQIVKQDKEQLEQLNDTFSTGYCPERVRNIMDLLISENPEAFIKHIRKYRKIYLILKHRMTSSQRRFINFAFRQNKKHNVPVKQDALSNIVSARVEDVKKSAKKATVYRLMSLLNYLALHYNMKTGETFVNFYRIRNGKVWINEKVANKDKQDLLNKANIILNEIKNRLNQDNVQRNVYIPNYVDYKLPISNKSMLGAIPLFSSYRTKLDDHHNLVFGVAWNKHADLDLHAETLDGDRFGWDDRDYSSYITFSGDMTELNNSGFASEAFEINKKLSSPIMLRLSIYSSDSEIIPFDLFASTQTNKEDIQELDDKDQDYIIKKFGVNSLYSKNNKLDANERTVAVIVPDGNNYVRVITVNTQFTKYRVPTITDLSHKLLEAIINKANIMPNLTWLLQQTGFNVINDIKEFNTLQEQYSKALADSNNKGVKTPDKTEFIDLTPSKLSNNSLISLFNQN